MLEASAARRMHDFGPRHTGNPAHQEFVNWLHRELLAIEQLDVSVDSQTFVRWTAGSAKLQIRSNGHWTGHNIAAVYPYSGEPVGGTPFSVTGVLTQRWPSIFNKSKDSIVYRKARCPNLTLLIRLLTRHRIGAVPLPVHWPVALEVTARQLMKRAYRAPTRWRSAQNHPCQPQNPGGRRFGSRPRYLQNPIERDAHQLPAR